MAECENEKVAPQHKSAFFSFIKSLATTTSDLSSLTAPPFLLSPQSLIEYSAYWSQHPTLFIAPSLEDTEEKRFLAVVKWFLGTLGEQHCVVDSAGRKKGGKKPLNPILGEVFKGHWEGVGKKGGRINLVAEQVEHHPPVTAAKIWNSEAGIQLHSLISPRAYFSTTVHIERRGYTTLTLSPSTTSRVKGDESYLLTLPPIHISGLLTGSLAPELSGSSYIRSSTGYTASIKYTTRGWVSGIKNGFSATITHDREPEKVLFKIEGTWSSTWTITDLRIGKVVEQVNVQDFQREEIQVPKISDQHPMESRRIWKPVADGIRDNDIGVVGKEKQRIEQAQRELRKVERKEGRDWERRYFKRVDGDESVDALIGGLKGQAGKDVGLLVGKGGLWVWDEDGEKQRGGRMGLDRTRYDSGVGGMVSG